MKTTPESFRKRVFCPSSETILEYAENSLSASFRQRTRRHLESCDFCGAELYFLSRHRPLDEPYISFPISSQGQVVIENALLAGSRRKQTQRAA
jgi:hypothetical protein